MNSSTVGSRVAAVRSRVTSLTSDGRGWILLTVSAGWFLGLGTRLAAPALVPYIRTDFGIGLSTAGYLLTVLWVTYAITQFPGGILGDRIGERKVLVAGGLLGVVAVIASGIAWSVPALFAGFVLLGTATGIYATTRFTVLVDVYPKQAATATGICSATGNVGTVVLPAAAGLLAAVLSWRWGFVAVAPLFAATAIGLWVTVPDRTSSEASALDDVSTETFVRLVREISGRRTIVFTVAMFLMSVVYQGFTSFYPSYLVSVKGLSEGAAALVYSTFFAAGIVIQPIAGAAADAVGDRSTMMLFSFVSGLAFAGLIGVGGFWALIGISVVLGAQLGFWPIAQAAVIETLSDELQGTGFGLLRSVYLLLAAAAPAIVGTMGERGLFDEAFLLLGGCAVVAGSLGLFLHDR